MKIKNVKCKETFRKISYSLEKFYNFLEKFYNFLKKYNIFRIILDKSSKVFSKKSLQNYLIRVTRNPAWACS